MLNRFRMLVACALTFALCWVPGFAFAGDAEDGAQVAATAHGLSYGIEGFERLAKGTARAMEGQPEGYRFPVDEDVDLVVAPAADRVVVWISPKAVEKYGLDLQDNECVSGLKALVCELDSVLLDPDKMRVALSNLLSNAIDFSPLGGEIRLAAMRSGENASCLWFDCIDQGAGVADSEIEQIFDPFVQGSRRRTGVDRGSGIGLSLVREAALAQGGRAFVVPAPRGAHFRMEIPNDE